LHGGSPASKAGNLTIWGTYLPQKKPKIGRIDQTDRQIDKHTDRHVDRNSSHPSRVEVKTLAKQKRYETKDVTKIIFKT